MADPAEHHAEDGFELEHLEGELFAERKDVESFVKGGGDLEGDNGVFAVIRPELVFVHRLRPLAPLILPIHMVVAVKRR